MKKIVTLFLFVFSFSVYSQYNFKVADSVLASYNKPGSPGVTVLVSKDGKVIYQKSGGYANIAKGELINNKTLFNLASDTKQFTAACVVMLSQKGKLKLDDNLAKYFPDFPEYAQKITVQDLLNHTAGLVDYRTAFWIGGKEVNVLSNEDIRNMLKATPLNFEPKTDWSYSNSNYWCLVQIVEQVSGMPISKFAEKNIFKPLKMKDTHYHRGVATLRNAAIGYKMDDVTYTEIDKDTGVPGGSGMFSTTSDMLKWLSEMQSKKVLGTAFWDVMLNGQKYTIGKEVYYSNALFFQALSGKKAIHHGGDLDGYHSDMSYFPDENVDIIVFTNRGDFNVLSMQKAITSQLFGFKYSWPAVEKPVVVKVPGEKIEQYSGVYEAEGMLFEITVAENAIHVLQFWDGSNYDIPATGQNSFTLAQAGADFLFEDIISGKAQTMKLTQEGETMPFKRAENYDFPDFSRFEGSYFCSSLNAKYTFSQQKGKLFYSLNGQNPKQVSVIEEDTVYIGPSIVLTFHRNNNEVMGFTLNHVRVKNLEFVKI
ncbi:serine hydrolase domain-containing protein [Flavobacterium suzhouense]|uniref:Serine hydrolase domain-containing protein n=1 Tax=Flavobacterium suzhouense TaxID=1529638 RepID=A0ABW5NSE1_9FLAO